MADFLNRRDWLRVLGLSSVAAGVKLPAESHGAEAASVGESSGFQSRVLSPRTVQKHRGSPSIIDGKVIQPQRELPVLHPTDVLVVGGGPAGVTAAIAAKRAGAERHAGRTLRPFRRTVDRRAGAAGHRAHRQGRQAGLPGHRRRDDAPPGQDRRRDHRPPPGRQPDRRCRGGQVRDGRDDRGGRRQGVPALLGRRRDRQRQRGGRGRVREQVGTPGHPGQDSRRCHGRRRPVRRRRGRVRTPHPQHRPGLPRRQPGPGRLAPRPRRRQAEAPGPPHAGAGRQLGEHDWARKSTDWTSPRSPGWR